MNKKTKLFFVLPVLLAITIGSVGISSVYAENDTMMDESHDTTKFVIETKGWAVTNGEARPSSISLKGDAQETKDGTWSLDASGSVDYSTGIADVTLKGMTNPVTGKIKLTGKGMADSGVEFILVLRGNFAPIYDQEHEYAVNWSTAKIYVPETGIKIPLLQHGIIEVMP